MIVRSAGFQWLVEDGGLVNGDMLGPFHEVDVESRLLALIPCGGVLVDVGAHVGHYTLRAAMKCAQVHAVEANNVTARKLAANIELNGVKNITVYVSAAWDSVCSLLLESPNGHDHDGSTRCVEGPLHTEELYATAAPLDFTLAHLTRIDFVKLDVEGADLHALRGMRKLLDKHRPMLFIEDHSIYGYYAREDLEKLLSELDYTWRNGVATNGGPFLIADPK